MIRQVNPEPTPQPEPSDNQGTSGKNSEAFQQQFQKEFPEAQEPTTYNDMVNIHKATSSKTMGERMQQDFPTASKKVTKFTLSEKDKRDEELKQGLDTTVKKDIAAAIRQQFPNLTRQEYNKLELKAQKYLKKVYNDLYTQALKADPHLTHEQFNKIALNLERQHLKEQGIDDPNTNLQRALVYEVMERVSAYQYHKKNPDLKKPDENTPPPPTFPKVKEAQDTDTTVMDEQIHKQLRKEFPDAQAPTTYNDIVELNRKLTGPNIEQQIKEQFPNIKEPKSAKDAAKLTKKIPSALTELYPELATPAYHKLNPEQVKNELHQQLTEPHIVQRFKDQFPNIERPKDFKDVKDIKENIPSTLKELYPTLNRVTYKKLRAEQLKLEKEIYMRVYNQAKLADPNLTTAQFNKIAKSIEMEHLQKEYPDFNMNTYLETKSLNKNNKDTFTFKDALKLEALLRIRQAYPEADQKELSEEALKAEHTMKGQVHDNYSNYIYLGMKMTAKEYKDVMRNLSWAICNALVDEEQKIKELKEIYKSAGVTLGGDGLEIET